MSCARFDNHTKLNWLHKSEALWTKFVKDFMVVTSSLSERVERSRKNPGHFLAMHWRISLLLSFATNRTTHSRGFQFLCKAFSPTWNGINQNQRILCDTYIHFSTSKDRCTCHPRVSIHPFFGLPLPWPLRYECISISGDYARMYNSLESFRRTNYFMNVSETTLYKLNLALIGPCNTHIYHMQQYSSNQLSTSVRLSPSLSRPACALFLHNSFFCWCAKSENDMQWDVICTHVPHLVTSHITFANDISNFCHIQPTLGN